MHGLAARLRACARRKPSPNTVRTTVRFKRASDYVRCRKQLAAIGVHPIKRSDKLRMLTYHAQGRRNRKQLRRHPRIAFVEKDFVAKAHGIKRGVRALAPVPWYVTRVQAPIVWPRSRRGIGVRLAVIDTGIAKHPDLRIAGGVNTIGGRSYADNNGHGTHVAGIAAAAAPRVDLYAVKALDANGDGYISDIVEGIEWSLDRGIRVINMSLGLTADSKALRAAVRRARRRGAIIVASAGNEGPSNRNIDYPARYPQTIAVAATDRNNKVASFSSRGSGIDISAPGEDIRSAYLKGRYATLSGTSMSAPLVAGGVALLRGLRPRCDADAIIRAIPASAKPIGSRRSSGYGLLRLSDAARIAQGRRYYR